MRYIMIMWVFISQSIVAHEWTPTYPELRLSHIRDIYKLEMKLFNSREDTEWYRINVFTKDWDTVPFALQGSQTVVNVKYQQTRWFDVYIRKRDIDRAEYVCSRSKLLEEDVTKPMFFSRICSKIK